MINKKFLIIGGVVILVCLIVSCLLLRKQIPTQSPLPPTLPAKSKKELKLSDFPEAFKDSTLIVVGDNASDIETWVANEILEYLETYGKTEEEMKIKCCVECIASFHPVEATKPHCSYFLTHSCKKVLNASNTFDFEVFRFCEKILNEKGFKVTQEVIYPDGRKVCNLNIYYKPGYCRCPDGSIKIKKINELGEENEICIDSLKIISYSKLTEEDKRNYNLIIIGTPKTNPFLEEVYATTNATRVTEEFPGEGKGVLEILPNPWNESKAMLLVEGSDKWGARVGSLMIVEENKKLTKERKFVDWVEYTGVEFPIDSEEEAIRYAKTDPGVRNFISAWTAKKGCRVISQVILHEPDEGLFGVGFGVRCFGEPVFDAGYEIRFKDNGEIILSVYRSI